jgi:hypothetical protein
MLRLAPAERTSVTVAGPTGRALYWSSDLFWVRGFPNILFFPVVFMPLAGTDRSDTSTTI